MRPCTLDDFGIGNGTHNTTSYHEKPTAQKIPEFERVIHALHCIEPVQLSGDWNSAAAKILTFTFEMCDSDLRDTCKNKTEVD